MKRKQARVEISIPRSEKELLDVTVNVLFPEGRRDYGGQTKRGAWGSGKEMCHSINSWTNFIYEH